MPAKPKPRSVGRPKTRPAGARECPVYLSPAEVETIDSLARAAGWSRAEWLRRTALTAAGIAVIPGQKK